MKQKAYLTAMQKIDISEEFLQSSTRFLLEAAEKADKNNDQNSIPAKYERLRKRPVMKLAAGILIFIVSTAGITAAASGINIVDIFKGFFKEPVKQETGTPGTGQNNSPGGYGEAATAAPLKEDNEFIEKASAVISSTVEGNGLKLTARGVVGDSHNLYIAIDVETEDGSAFNTRQQSEVEGLTFNNVWLLVNDNVLGQYCRITRVDDTSEPGKATFVLQNSLELKNTGGEIRHIQLSFTNLIQPSSETVIDIGTNKSMLEIMETLGEAPAEDYYFMGPRFQSKEDIDWYREKRDQIKQELEDKGEIDRSKTDYDSLFGRVYELMEEEVLDRGMLPKYTLKRTEQQVTFCSAYPELAVSNIGIRNDQLCVKFEFNDSISYESFSDARIIIRDKRNGNIIRGMDTGNTPDNGGEDPSQAEYVNDRLISRCVQFSGIASEEELKDYYFAFGGGGFSYQTLYEGEWKLDFDLSYTDTTREYSVSKEIVFGGLDRKLTGISLSPISMQLRFDTPSADETTAGNTSDDLREYTDTDSIKLLMKDGTDFPINQYSWDDGSLNTVFAVIIDLDKAAEIEINGVKIDLQ